jgi:tetratricopeptide (TPR) repeat protein
MNERWSDIDVSDWADVEPAELLLKPSLVLRHPPLEAAARAILYARAAADASYDEIGFRLRAATPKSSIGYAPLETFATARRSHEQAARRQAATEAERVRSEQVMLRHRAIDFEGSGRMRFAVEGDLVHLMVTADDGTEEDWTYALSHPPKLLRARAVKQDARQLVAQQLQVDAPGMRWLPMPLLVEAGRFRRMQEWAQQLETTTVPGRYYAFVSHRWLTPAHPDPEGRQAQFVAWQLVAYLCEAIRVAQLRGLHEPGLESAAGFSIGVQGSDLAESIVVNVLRQALDDQSLQRVGAEAAAIRELTRDHGVTAAAADSGLGNLRAVLTEHPALASLVAQISVWYDYSCLPQPPRTKDEDILFRQGLHALNPCQMLGITVVLLDDAEDYLTRAWCTLEGLVADAFGAIGTLVGSRRPTAATGTVEDWFGDLLQDRPHIVWRALLDTEVLGVQDAQTCLERLSLAATDRDDLPFIYHQLRSLRAPRKVQVDQSEIVTGTLPLPALDDGWVLAAGSGQAMGSPEPHLVGSLDWTDALALSGTESVRQRMIASWSPRASHADQADAAHLAIVAACEGEAVLIASWIESRLSELETMLELDVVSISWTASDIAPIGHLAEGTLELRAVEAPVWVLATVRRRLQYDSVTSVIARAVTASGRQLVRLVLDETEDNVELVPPGDDDPKTGELGEATVAVDPADAGTWVGGLHRQTLVDILTGRTDEGAPAQKVDGEIQLEGIPLIERDLFQQLLAAQTTEYLKELVSANLQQVLAAFPTWTTVPSPIREDPEAANRYANGLILIAQILDELGHPDPLQALQGDRDSNPIHRWHQAFAQSQVLAEAGRHTESTKVLSSLLSELDHVSGSAVDDLRPKALGMVGTVWFQAGDIGQALLWTRRALEACLASGDREGVATYRESLQVLEALHLPAVDPEAGARLLECRRLIAAAQSASDGFDYAESNQALGDALAIISEGGERLRASFAGKIYGLRGWNYHYQGDDAAARADTERALAECRTTSDPNGVRVYTANLKFLSDVDDGANQAPKSALGLGLMLEEQGDVAGARTAYQQAIDSGHPEQAPKAAYSLGRLLLTERGDVAGARTAYQQAIDSGHPDAAPMAAYGLGLLLEEQGNVAGARAAYQQAIDSGHPDAAPMAAVNLGVLLKQQGDVAGAQAAYQQAIDSGHPEHASRAALGLGELLEEQGDVAGARAAYQQAIDSGHPDAPPGR